MAAPTAQRRPRGPAGSHNAQKRGLGVGDTAHEGNPSQVIYKDMQLDLVILDTAESTWEQAVSPDVLRRSRTGARCRDARIIPGMLLKPTLPWDARSLILGSSRQRFARSCFTWH